MIILILIIKVKINSIFNIRYILRVIKLIIMNLINNQKLIGDWAQSSIPIPIYY